MRLGNTIRPRIVIGIDPDVDGSGVGVIDMETREVTKEQLALPELVDFLKSRLYSFSDIMVYIEAGWMNGGNHHLQNKGQWHASKIGEQVGRNHQVSKLIGEFCEYHGIPHTFVRPLTKHWHGKDGKITHEELMSLIEGSGLKMAKCRTNQEMRDAILLAMNHSNIALRMAPKKLGKLKAKQ